MINYYYDDNDKYLLVLNFRNYLTKNKKTYLKNSEDSDPDIVITMLLSIDI
jgi:hypothetical protein